MEKSSGTTPDTVPLQTIGDLGKGMLSGEEPVVMPNGSVQTDTSGDVRQGLTDFPGEKFYPEGNLINT